MWALIIFVCTTLLQSIIQVQAGCPDAVVIPSQDGFAEGLSVLAGFSQFSGFNFSCSATPLTNVKGLVAEFTPPETKSYGVRIRDCGSADTFDPIVKVIEGNCTDDTEIFCNDNFVQGNICSGTLGIPLTAGVKYTIVVSEVHNTGGPITPPDSAALIIGTPSTDSPTTSPSARTTVSPTLSPTRSPTRRSSATISGEHKYLLVIVLGLMNVIIFG